MKLNVYSLQKAEVGKVDLPKQFDEPIRADLIKRAVKAIDSHDRQPYGSNPDAGMRHSAFVSKRRHKFKTTYGIGQSRTPRKVMSARGTRFNWVGAVAPQTVGGRRAHPPKVSKIWDQKINKKEKRKAIRSALAAVMSPEVVAKRGHAVPEGYPFIVESKIEDITRTKDAIAALEKLGIGADLERSSVRKIRAGKGKARGRKYKTRIGPLIVVSKKDSIAFKSFSNIPGVDIIAVDKLNAKSLAPGMVAGRLTLFSQKAVERIADEMLFTDYAKVNTEKTAEVSGKKAAATENKATAAKEPKPSVMKNEEIAAKPAVEKAENKA